MSDGITIISTSVPRNQNSTASRQRQRGPRQLGQKSLSTTASASSSAEEPPPELTARALGGGVLVGGMLCFSNMYFGLQTGWVTMGSLQSALLGYGMFKVMGPHLLVPFTAKENVVLQTTAVAAATMPLCGGFVGIIPAFRLLSEAGSNNTAGSHDDTDNDYGSILEEDSEYNGEPSSSAPIIHLLSSPTALFGWCLALGFFGVFMAPPLRRQTILREKLPFPSGTATAEIIRQLHGLPKEGEGLRSSNRCKKKDDDHNYVDGARDDDDDIEEVELVDETTQLVMANDGQSSGGGEEASLFRRLETPPVVALPDAAAAPPPAWRLLFLSFTFSAAYTLLGFFVPILKNIPIGTYIGLPSLTAWSWTLQPSPSYFGQGLIMGPRTAVSMLLGTVVGWGMLAPMAQAEGWADGPIQDAATGARGWLLWVSLAIMLADSAVSLGLLSAKVLLRSLPSFRVVDMEEELDPAPPDQQITWRTWLPGLILASILCTAVLTPMFDMPVYEPVIAVLFSLLVAVLAVRALGETDLNPVSGIGKVSQLLFAIVSPGNVVANLVAGAVAEAGAISAGDMMQDLQCGHLLKASPKAQFIAQLVGTLASCVMVVAAWTLYSSAYEIPGPEFPAPTALIWLDMARVVSGGGHIATNVMPTAIIAAVIAALLPLVETLLPLSRRRIVPSAMAAAIGMYVTPNWTLPRVAGGLANYAWRRWDQDGAERYMIVVASGFVLGEGLTGIVNAFLKSAGVDWVWCGGCPVGYCSGCP